MNKTVGRTFIYLLLVGWLVMQAAPPLYMLLSSFKSQSEIMVSPWALPETLDWSNFVEAWTDGHFGEYFVNSLLVTTGTLGLLIFLALLAGYALARYEFPGRKLVFLTMVAALVVPVHALIVPIYALMRDIGLLNNLLGLVLVYTAFSLPFSIVLMRAYFETLPRALEEAARLDGCSEFEVFWHVAVPMSRGAVMTLVILNAVSIWSELMFALILVPAEGVRTLPVAVQMFATSMFQSALGPLFAALCIVTLPSVLLYFMFSHRIQEGMAFGSMK